MKREYILLASVFLLIGLSVFVIAENDLSGNTSNDTVACTMDAKMCPDGSYVGRVAPDCEFAPCPKTEDDEEQIVGDSCGTVTPGYQNECCQRKGYVGWDEENFTCIGERVKEKAAIAVGSPRLMTAAPVAVQYMKDERVCCKIYGYGTEMEEVNVEYKIMKNEDCSVPEDFVGGNREIVRPALCLNEGNLTEEQKMLIIKERNRIRASANQSECPEDCECSGSAVKCSFENGTRIMNVYAGNSGNVIIQVKNVNMSTNVTLYKEDGKIFANFSGNKTKEIHMPDEIKDMLQNRTHTRLYNESVNLTEDGYYQIEGRKRSRLFLLIPVREHTRAQIDAETGETIKIRNPWWGFLARDIRNNTED